MAPDEPKPLDTRNEALRPLARIEFRSPIIGNTCVHGYVHGREEMFFKSSCILECDSLTSARNAQLVHIFTCPGRIQCIPNQRRQ